MTRTVEKLIPRRAILPRERNQGSLIVDPAFKSVIMEAHQSHLGEGIRLPGK
ncbi:MAG: hypothetical protein M3Y08_20510 [Fibrobacterota bacterium]|nr:hypothetical protein [Fibrobacterota bacterium]